MGKYFKNMSDEKEAHFFNKAKLWLSYWRENPQRFTVDYLGIDLKFFQQILMYEMFHNRTSVFIAARGLGKSWLTAVIACVRCILYPHSRVVICSSTKQQAAQMIKDKIETLKRDFPKLDIEIEDICTGTNEPKVIFKNGSTIEAVASNEGARGKRASMLIIDEYVLVEEKIYQSILKPFMNFKRPVGFKTGKILREHPEYKQYEEDNIQIFMSSAKYKIDWYWDLYRDSVDEMLRRKVLEEEVKNEKGEIEIKKTPIKSFAVALPYTLSVFHDLLSKEAVADDKRKFDPIQFAMEDEAIFYGENSQAYFKLNEIQKCRNTKQAFYPIDNIKFIENKNSKNKIKNNYPAKVEGEVRIISADIALMGGNGNDNSIFTCIRGIPDGDEYRRIVPYMESHNGMLSEDQAIRLHQLYDDFEADYICIDCNGNGMSVYEDLTRILTDENRNKTYNGFKSFNDEKMADRAKDPNAKAVIFTIKAVGNNSINNDIAIDLKKKLSENKIDFLVEQSKMQQKLELKAFNMKLNSDEEKIKLKELTLPYQEIDNFQKEIIALVYEVKNGNIYVKEVGKNRKDRYSSVAYGNHLISILEQDLVKPKQENNVLDYCSFGYATGKII